MSKKFLKLYFLLVVVIFLTTACAWKFPWQKDELPAASSGSELDSSQASSTTENIVYTNNLKKFENPNALSKFLADNSNPEAELSLDTSVAQASLNGYLSPTLYRNKENAPANYFDNSVSLTGDSQKADIIKTDSNYVYALAKNELVIMKSSPVKDVALISRIVFKSRPTGLLLSGNFVAIFGRDEQITNQTAYQDLRHHSSYTFFKVFDLTDPTSPQLVRDLSFEGTYRDARLIGDYVYFLTDTNKSYVVGETPYPLVMDSGQVLANKCESAVKCFVPEVYYFDMAYKSYRFINVALINIKNNSEPLSGQDYLLNSGQDFYVTSNNVYVSYSPNINEYELRRQASREVVFSKLSVSDQTKINKIESASSFTLSDSEKKIKVAQIIDDFLSTSQTSFSSDIDSNFKQKLSERLLSDNKTLIYKFSFVSGKLEYRASSEVGGRILSQSSLDDNGDYLRVATESLGSGSSSSANSDFYSSLYILDNDLKAVGSLENIATAVKISDVRFIGDRAYFVSQKAEDPLLVMSLTDPTKPIYSGALKIGGLSNYIYPADKNGNKLISLSYDMSDGASSSTKIKGVKLSLLDFSDFTKPKELDSYSIGDAMSDSLAFYDHQSFVYSEDKKLLSFPTTMHDSKGRLSFAGSLVFSVDDKGLQLKGKIDHSSGGHFGQLDSWAEVDYYDNAVKRVLYLGENFISFSNKFLKINSLTDLSEVKSLELTTRGNDYLISSPATVSSNQATPDVNAAASGNDLPPSPPDTINTPNTSNSSSTPDPVFSPGPVSTPNYNIPIVSATSSQTTSTKP